MRDLRWRFAIGVFALLLIHGATIGLTDDEAYYWVLAQKPAWGYAFHPPMVAWFIALFQGLLGWLAGTHSVWLVRLPGALSVAAIVWLALDWVKAAAGRVTPAAGWVVLSFAGFFSLSWMMVPDLPLFLGWMLAFRATWELCEGRGRAGSLALLFAGAAMAMLSKYSGILVVVSSAACLLFWSRSKLHGFLALALALAVAAAPILAWNSAHGWGSLLYQLSERHGGGLSLSRFARFWVLELVLAGPAAIFFSVALFFDHANFPPRVLAAWIFPAALVFCAQPLFGDFKPHWAFVVWWPAFLGLAWSEASGGIATRLRPFAAIGLALGALVLVACHLPLVGGALRLARGEAGDPRWDVTNDLYGWSELRAFVRDKAEAQGLPVVGSRYQTAAQAAFALGGDAAFTLLPRDLKARDEWPALPISDGYGPDWPKLRESILYVADNRYEDGPGYPGARCAKLGALEALRLGMLAKRIDLWRCDP
jgi:4-amino-4-deoxy-L-arabinose transferase-like glycosyltransferase